ncbi:sigma-54 dependent transcriptional regulator [Sphingobium sufflavum]|uniref:sigma-54-dependent transcriptional regulator n=1 Tax=Sphingobium sufflavum TaxID=1129547 RepID=UPI001F22BB90|nr:sigma-54 dependent transcriptional regulator [Sphingobium sufflavum]MCE7797565.1 sigma-54 dependent transcriptional regulator [Sphingobium sufflavum]
MTDAEQPLLLLVDDEPAQRRLTTALAARAGWRTLSIGDGDRAIQTLGTRDGMRVAAVLIDDWTPGLEMAELVRTIAVRRPNLPILILTANDNARAAVEAMRAGASDFLIKPVTPERLAHALATAASKKDAGELRRLTTKIQAPLDFNSIIGSSTAFRSALSIAAQAARSGVPILIEGESGVGKDVIAHAIHAASARAAAPMAAINCRAIPEKLLDSELFGHERGAFTGAFDRHVGRLATAHGGTIFLDEVSELSLDAQVKLLRLVKDHEILPLGARHPVHVDVRVVTAANKPLLGEVEAGRFREDLYYRLNTVQIVVPPLRERIGDIAALARHLLARIATQPGLRDIGITADAIALLTRHDWPGNVRQLQNTLFRAAVLCEGDALTPTDFPQIAAHLAEGATGTATRSSVTPIEALRMGHGQDREAAVPLYEPNGHLRALADIEADVIRLAITHYRGRMTEVARRLGIGRSTLYRKLAELGIDTAA